MTDFSDDELVSAVIDGEATDEEIARVRDDPALSSRLVELRDVRDALASSTITTPSARERDAAVAAAVSAAISAARVDLQTLRARRRHRTVQVASIAAALLVLVGIIGGLLALARRSDRPSNSTAAREAASGPTPAAAASGAASPTGVANQSAPVVADLGTFATRDALIVAARDAAGNAAFTQASRSAAAPGASAAPAPQSPLDSGASQADGTQSTPSTPCASQPDVQLVSRATLDGQPVIVVVRGTAPQQTLDVYDTSCMLSFTAPL